jgi:hypothetical protein
MRIPATLIGPAILALACAGTVGAVQPPVDYIRIWQVNEGESIDRAVFLDVDPLKPGVELFGISMNCSRTDPVDGKISTVVRTRVRSYAADGSGEFLQLNPPLQVTSGAYPDLNDPQFQCNGANQTIYETEFRQGCAVGEAGFPINGPGSFDPNEGDGPSGLCGIFPEDFLFGFGIANAGEARFLVLGDGVRGEWRNDVEDGDASAYEIGVYDTAGSRIWRRRFLGRDVSNFVLLPEVSGVADFLGSGADVLRVGRIREEDNGNRFKYEYFDIATGSKIGSNIVFFVPAP